MPSQKSQILSMKLVVAELWPWTQIHCNPQQALWNWLMNKTTYIATTIFQSDDVWMFWECHNTFQWKFNTSICRNIVKDDRYGRGISNLRIERFLQIYKLYRKTFLFLLFTYHSIPLSIHLSINYLIHLESSQSSINHLMNWLIDSIIHLVMQSFIII